jgi:DNA-binding transcriptional LysR family regulator
VTEISMVLVTASDHPLTKLTRPVDIGLLASEPIIMSELSIGYGQIVGSMFDDIGIRPRTSAVVDNIETMKVAVQSGIGIALVPEGSADNEARLGLLSIIPLAHTRKLTISAYQNRRATARRKEAILKRVVVLSDTTSP